MRPESMATVQRTQILKSELRLFNRRGLRSAWSRWLERLKLIWSQMVGYPKIAMNKIFRFAWNRCLEKVQTYFPQMVVELKMVMNTMGFESVTKSTTVHWVAPLNSHVTFAFETVLRKKHSNIKHIFLPNGGRINGGFVSKGFGLRWIYIVLWFGWSYFFVVNLPGFLVCLLEGL